MAHKFINPKMPPKHFLSFLRTAANNLNDYLLPFLRFINRFKVILNGGNAANINVLLWRNTNWIANPKAQKYRIANSCHFKMPWRTSTPKTMGSLWLITKFGLILRTQASSAESFFCASLMLFMQVLNRSNRWCILLEMKILTPNLCASCQASGVTMAGNATQQHTLVSFQALHWPSPHPSYEQDLCLQH